MTNWLINQIHSAIIWQFRTITLCDFIMTSKLILKISFWGLSSKNNTAAHVGNIFGPNLFGKLLVTVLDRTYLASCRYGFGLHPFWRKKIMNFVVSKKVFKSFRSPRQTFISQNNVSFIAIFPRECIWKFANETFIGNWLKLQQLIGSSDTFPTTFKFNLSRVPSYWEGKGAKGIKFDITVLSTAQLVFFYHLLIDLEM